MSEPTTEWEIVCEGPEKKTTRLRVEGGWIYATQIGTTGGIAITSAFVPDYDADMERISDLSDLIELVGERADNGNKRMKKKLDQLEDEMDRCIDAVLAKR